MSDQMKKTKDAVGANKKSKEINAMSNQIISQEEMTKLLALIISAKLPANPNAEKLQKQANALENKIKQKLSPQTTPSPSFKPRKP